jgi:hypothetical protein
LRRRDQTRHVASRRWQANQPARRRLEQERQRLASLEARGIAHTRCSDVTLAEFDVLLAQADAKLAARNGSGPDLETSTCFEGLEIIVAKRATNKKRNAEDERLDLAERLLSSLPSDPRMARRTGTPRTPRTC